MSIVGAIVFLPYGLAKFEWSKRHNSSCSQGLRRTENMSLRDILKRHIQHSNDGIQLKHATCIASSNDSTAAEGTVEPAVETSDAECILTVEATSFMPPGIEKEKPSGLGGTAIVENEWSKVEAAVVKSAFGTVPTIKCRRTLGHIPCQSFGSYALELNEIPAELQKVMDKMPEHDADILRAFFISDAAYPPRSRDGCKTKPVSTFPAVSPLEDWNGERCKSFGILDASSEEGTSPTRWQKAPKPATVRGRQQGETSSGNFHLPCQTTHDTPLGSLGSNRQDGQGKGQKHHSVAASDTSTKATTLMISNLPCRLSYDEIVEEIDCMGFAGAYEFVHVPQRVGQANSNIGYAFVNFFASEDAERFALDLNGHRFPGSQSTRTCEVKVAKQQGFNGHAAQMNKRQAC